MKKQIACICLVVSMTLVGCGAAVPDLTEEQRGLITEYAANLLLKHNDVENKSLLSDEELKKAEEEEAKELERAKKKKEAEEAYLKAQANKNTSTENADGSSGSGEGSDKSDQIGDLASFFGMDGFQIQYAGNSFCSSYPEETRDDYFLAMDATQGNQLCVIKLQVTNVSSEDADFDMFEKKGSFYLTINGEKVPAQATLLLDDFAAYKGVIAAGQSEEMVLIFEVPESTSQTESMELIARYGSARGTMILQ